jgi:hypothetical protein
MTLSRVRVGIGRRLATAACHRCSVELRLGVSGCLAERSCLLSERDLAKRACRRSSSSTDAQRPHIQKRTPSSDLAPPAEL